MKKDYKKQTAAAILGEVIQLDESKHGRIPTYFGKFTHPVTKENIDFDKDFLNGGFSRRNVHYFMAPPNEGKTFLAVQTATRQAENGFNVLYITLEQTPFKIIGKVLSLLDHNKYFREVDWEKLPFIEDDKEFGVMKKRGLDHIEAYLDDRLQVIYGSFSTEEMTTLLQTEIKSNHWDMIYIDNFTNATYTKNRTESFELMSRNVRQSVLISDKTALCWLTQMDETTKRTKNSRALDEDADLGIRISRKPVEDDKPEWKKQKDNEAAEKAREEGITPSVQDAPITYLSVVKNRSDGEKCNNLAFPFDKKRNRLGSFVLENIEDRLIKVREEKIKKKNTVQDEKGLEEMKENIDKMFEEAQTSRG